MTEITKDTVIGDILDICPDAAPYFLQMGMHGVDADDLLEQINALIRK